MASNRQPHLCMVFEAIGPFNAIGRIAQGQVEAALSAGWKVTVVAHRLAEELQGQVHWRRLYNPPRGFALKWLTADFFIRRAMGPRSQYDVVHGHQPQIAGLCDLFQCHFLSAMAAEAGCLGGRTATLRDKVVNLQHRVVLRAEERCYRKFSERTQLVLVSGYLAEGFAGRYGLPPDASVWENPAPQVAPVRVEERAAARRSFGLREDDGLVVGYFGGMQARKGFAKVCEIADAMPDAQILFAGQGTDVATNLPQGVRGQGLVSDPSRFYAALDVLVVPSLFDPCPVVTTEAASRGVGLVVSTAVGNAQAIVDSGAGARVAVGAAAEVWVAAIRDSAQLPVRAASLRFAELRSWDHYRSQLLRAYDDILHRRKLTQEGDA